MKKLSIIFLFIVVLAGASCKKYLDEAYQNPNNYVPGTVPLEEVLPSIISNMHRGIAFDGRSMGPFVQYFARTATQDPWERQGYIAASDGGGEIWRMHYWNFGHNTLDMYRSGMQKGQYDYAAVAYTILAWGWLNLTDYHGEVILKQAFDKTRLSFDYDKQEEVYPHVIALIDTALQAYALAATMTNQTLSVGDQYLYQGNLDKWKKFAYGVKAKAYHRYWNKSNYSPDSVIKYVDLSFTSHADDALQKFNPAAPDATGLNFFGPTRNNMGTFRAGKFAIDLMNGAILTGAPIDPRLRYIFQPSGDGVFRGLEQNKAFTGLVTNQQPNNFWGFAGTTAPTGGNDANARTYFKNTSPFPLMTYAELQFIKAEAAFKKGLMTEALTAYQNGIRGNMDMLTTYFTGYVNFTAAERDAYINSAVISPPAASLTRRQILLQKYIALWGWGFVETWVDMRKEQYNAVDIYTGYKIPTGSDLFPDNGGELVYRVRPRYNSEYLWNVEALREIGALNANYHTYKVWFSEP